MRDTQPALRATLPVARRSFFACAGTAAGALSTSAGYEAMNIIRKGQIRWLPKSDVAGQKRFIERTLGITA